MIFFHLSSTYSSSFSISTLMCLRICVTAGNPWEIEIKKDELSVDKNKRPKFNMCTIYALFATKLCHTHLLKFVWWAICSPYFWQSLTRIWVNEKRGSNVASYIFFYKETRSHRGNCGTCQTFGVLMLVLNQTRFKYVVMGHLFSQTPTQYSLAMVLCSTCMGKMFVKTTSLLIAR
jgi:hypothetical protein